MAVELGKDKITFLVPPELRDIPLWEEQSAEESSGKDGKGITVYYGENLNIDSLKPIENNDRVFVRINLPGKETDEKFVSELKEKGYPVFDIDDISIMNIGGLFMGLEYAILELAYLWGFNPINQKAVEGYKRKTREVSAGLKEGEIVSVPAEWESGKAEYNDLITEYHQPIIDAGIERQKVVDQIKSGDYTNLVIPMEIEEQMASGQITIKEYAERVLPGLELGIITEQELKDEVARLGTDMGNAAAVSAAIHNIANRKGSMEAAHTYSYGRMTDEFRAVLQDARSIYTNKFKIPTKLGEGPDINHFFVQNDTAGRDFRVATYIMPLDAKQPEFLEYDVNLLRAPTIGTVQSMIEVGRKAMLLTLNKSIDDLTEEDLKGIRQFYQDVDQYLDAPGTDKAMLSQQAIEDLVRSKYDTDTRFTTKSLFNKIREAVPDLSVADLEDRLQTLADNNRIKKIGDKWELNPVGGINLNPELLDLQIKRDGKGVPLPVFEQPIGEMKIDGFMPVIINVMPVYNMPLLLGIADRDEKGKDLGYKPGHDPYAIRKRFSFVVEEQEEVYS